ncbi:hypothetical protein [Bradyrhizobium sp. 142]|nr:hypothetical protein [Bradyrhizobium sp. 142]
MKKISKRTIVFGAGALALSAPFVGQAKASTPISFSSLLKNPKN